MVPMIFQKMLFSEKIMRSNSDFGTILFPTVLIKLILKAYSQQPK